MRRYPLRNYFGLACAISWACMIPAFVLSEQWGYTMLTPETIGEIMVSGFQDSRHILLTIVGTLSSYGPVIAAVLMSLLEGGGMGLREWWRRVSNVRLSGHGYRDLIVLILAIFVPLAAVGMVFGPRPGSRTLVAPLAYFLPYLIYELLTSGMEEPGWRGYALPRLQERHTAKKSSLILGLVWGIWHWPAFIPAYYNALSGPSTPVIAAFIQAAIQCAIYILVSILAASFIHTWLYNRTRSAFSNLLLHGGSNSISGYVMAVMPNPIMGLIYGIVRWVMASVLIRFLWQEPDLSLRES